MHRFPHVVFLILVVALVATAQAPDKAWSHPDATPIRFLAGDDAGADALSMYVTSYVVSDNGMSIALALRGVPGSTLKIDSLFKLHNADETPHAVTLSATPVALPQVLAYSLEFYDAHAPIVRLDLTASSPAGHLVIPAGATHAARLTLTFASEASLDDAAAATSLTLHAA